MRIGVVSTPPTPYRDPFWNVVARQPEVELEVLYCAGGNADRPWELSWAIEYPAEFMPGWNLGDRRGMGRECYWNPGVCRRLRKGHYDALIFTGYNHLTNLVAMRWAVRNRMPYFLHCESNLRKLRAVWQRWGKRALVRWVVKHAAGGFPTGTLARDYLLHYGADRETLAFVPNVPDVVAVAKDAQKFAPQRSQLRRRYGLDDNPVVLFVGRFVGNKNVDVLIRAFSRIQRRAGLVLVGDGPLRNWLERLAANLDLSDRVRFTGWVQPPELPKWRATADLFILPSRETWGVAAVEALASGLPVVLSDQVGSHPDLINHPDVGSVVPCGDEAAMAEAIDEHLQRATRRQDVDPLWAPVFQEMRYDVVARRMIDGIDRGIERHEYNNGNGRRPPEKRTIRGIPAGRPFGRSSRLHTVPFWAGLSLRQISLACRLI